MQKVVTLKPFLWPLQENSKFW